MPKSRLDSTSENLKFTTLLLCCKSLLYRELPPHKNHFEAKRKTHNKEASRLYAELWTTCRRHVISGRHLDNICHSHIRYVVCHPHVVRREIWRDFRPSKLFT